MSTVDASSAVPKFRIQEFTVRYSETGRDGTLKLRPLFDYAQEAAACHAETIGVGMSYLLQHDLAWMLSRIKFGLCGALPKYGEKITLETYPIGFERLFALREYILRNEAGEVFATGSSQWILVDTKRMRPVLPKATLQNPLPDNTGRVRHYDDIDKLPALEAPDAGWDYAVMESGVDVNLHLNNAEYAALVQNFLHQYDYKVCDIDTVQINFVQGTVPGETIHISGNVSGKSFACEGSVDGKVVFQAAGQLK